MIVPVFPSYTKAGLVERVIYCHGMSRLTVRGIQLAVMMRYPSTKEDTPKLSTMKIRDTIQFVVRKLVEHGRLTVLERGSKFVYRCTEDFSKQAQDESAEAVERFMADHTFNGMILCNTEEFLGLAQQLKSTGEIS